MVQQAKPSDLAALRNEIDRLWAETRLLRQKLATSWEMGVERNPKPLYDSGWVLSAAGTHTFTHSLSKVPLLVSLMAADDASGTNPVIMMVGLFVSGANTYGFREDACTTTQLSVVLYQDGYAYTGAGAKWYQRGIDYIRLLAWATE